jgi:hypothetical protein
VGFLKGEIMCNDHCPSDKGISQMVKRKSGLKKKHQKLKKKYKELKKSYNKIKYRFLNEN